MSALKSNTHFFKSFSDSDFYTDKFTHIYFYDVVSKQSITELKDEILKACEPTTSNGVVKNPKPILLHINSPGGHVDAGMSSMSIFTECKVPIAVMVDGMSASAATFLSIYAPYRIGTPYSTCLIHEASGLIAGKDSDMQFYMKVGSKFFRFLKKMYLKKTKIPKHELKSLLQHDLILDAETCKKYGIFDKIIDPEEGRTSKLKRYNYLNKDLNLPCDVMLKKGNMNHVKIECSRKTPNIYLGVKELLQKIDMLVFQENTEVRPVIFHTSPQQCSSSMYAEYFPLISKISALHIPCIGVIDSLVTLHDILPILCCEHRIMYECAQVTIHIMYTRKDSLIFDDVIKNTMLILNKIKAFLREKTKIPEDVIENLEKKRYVFDHKKCLEYGIVQEVIKMV